MAKAGGASLDMDVVYSGYLLYKMKGKLSSAYHQVVCSLRRESLQGGKRLELKDVTSGKITVVPFRAPVEVREVVIKKDRDSHPFEVISAKVKHLLVAENCEERDTWLGHINKVLSGEPEPGVTYEFRVSLQENESSKKQGLSGNYVLKVSDCSMALYSATSLIPTQFTLKLAGIKRLQQCSLVDKHGNKEEILVIYTMPQSEVGDGTFVFKADDAGGISQVIDWRIKNVIQTTGSPGEGAGGADTSPPPPQVPDRRGRHTKQVESHIYHEEPRIDLSERNGSVSSSRSTRSLKHQMSDVSTSSGGSFHGNSYRRTLSSLKRGNSEDHPPTPPPRTVPKRPSVSDSDNIDDEILVGTHEIQAQIEALKKGGLLPQRSYSQMDEQPLSPRRRPLRGTMSGGSPPFDVSGHRLSEARSESRSPPLSSPGASRNHSSLASNCSDRSPNRKRFSKQGSSSSLAQTFTSDFPIDVIVRHDREMGHRQTSAESMPLSKWQPHKVKESRIPPQVPERDRDESESYYLRDIDINPGPVRAPRPNPVGNSGSEMGSASTTNSSTDENGYLILTQDDKEAIAHYKNTQESESSTGANPCKMDVQEQLYSEVDDFRERSRHPLSPCSNEDYETVPEEVGGTESMHRSRHLSGRQVEEVYDVDDEVLVSPSYVGKNDPSSPLSHYYNVRGTGSVKPDQLRGSSSEDFDDASVWKDSYTSDAEDDEYYNGPFLVPNGAAGVSGQWNLDEAQRSSATAEPSYEHADDADEKEYYNNTEPILPSGRPQKKHPYHSSSVTTSSDVSSAVSATQCSGGASDTDEDEREDPRDVAQLSRTWQSRQEHSVFNSVEKLNSVKFSQGQVSVNNSIKSGQ